VTEIPSIACSIDACTHSAAELAFDDDVPQVTRERIFACVADDIARLLSRGVKIGFSRYEHGLRPKQAGLDEIASLVRSAMVAMIERGELARDIDGNWVMR
jgi:hypothetical protein